MLWALVGISVLGPTFNFIAATPNQGGFANFSGIRAYLYLAGASLFPPAALVFASYDGTVIAILLACVLLGLWHRHDRRQRA
ncbi:MAG: hypothetical protein ACRD1M_16115 [Terriglobales bacterium]